MPDCVYVIIRLKMSNNVNFLNGSLSCHYGENDDVFSIGSLVEPDENLMGSAIRPCHQSVNHRIKPKDRVFMAKLLNSFMNYELVEISIYVIDVHFIDFIWRARHRTLAMSLQAVDHRD